MPKPAIDSASVDAPVKEERSIFEAGQPEPTEMPPHSGIILGIILVSYFMIVLNNSIIFTGLPQIRAEMGLSANGMAWAQNAFTLIFGGLLPLGARVGDLLGRRRVFVIGLVLFGSASFMVGAAETQIWLIGARAFQGVGAAIVAPSSLSLITAIFPAGPPRTRAVAAYGTTAGIGASLGMVIGGALASWVSWRAGFFLNVPLVALLVIAALLRLPVFDSVRGRFDVIGAITSTLGMGALVYGVLNVGEHGWMAPQTYVPILAGVVVLAIFVITEWRAKEPIMPLRLFASAQRSGAAIARLLFAGTMIAFYFFGTQYFQDVYGWSPLMAGLGFLPMSLVQLTVSLSVPRLTARFGNAALVTTGLVIATAAMGWITQIRPDSSFMVGTAGPLILLGIGQGIAFGPLTAAGIAGARTEDAGAASGLVNTAHQLGSTLGVAVLTSVAAGAVSFEDQVVGSFMGGTVMLGLAVLATAALIIPGELRTRRKEPIA